LNPHRKVLGFPVDWIFILAIVAPNKNKNLIAALIFVEINSHLKNILP